MHSMRCDNVKPRLVREKSCTRLILFTFNKESVRKVRWVCKLLNVVLPVGAFLALVAGIEANILTMGACLIACVLYEAQSTTFYLATFMQMSLVISNLIPSKEIVDGEVALNTLFNVKSIYAVARKWTRSKKQRRKLIRDAGLPGVVCIALFRVIVFANQMYLTWNAIIVFGPVLLTLRYCM